MRKLARTWRLRLMRGSRGDAGFTIVEITVAIGILALVMTMLSVTLATGMRSILTGKQREVATQEASRMLELGRSLAYDNIGLAASDTTMAADAAVVTVAGVKSYLVDAAALKYEPLAFAVNTTAHPFNPHTSVVNRGSTRLTRYVYITSVDADNDGRTDYKRLLVRIVWDRKGTSSAASNEVRAQTFVSESGQLPVGVAPAGTVVCPPGAASCLTGFTPLSAKTTASGGSLSVRTSSGSIVGLVNAAAANVPPVTTALSSTAGSTTHRAVSTSSCTGQSSSLQGANATYGRHVISASADNDPTSPVGKENSSSWGPGVSDPVSGLDDVDRLLVEPSLASTVTCLANASNVSGDAAPAPDDSLPYEKGTASGPSSITMQQTVAGAGLPASDVLTVAELASPSLTQVIDHSANSGVTQIASTASGSLGQTRLLRIPGVVEQGLVRVDAMSFSASTTASDGTPNAAPSVSATGGVTIRLFDPGAALPAGACDSRAGDYCVKTIDPASAGFGGYTQSLTSSVTANAGLTTVSFEYRVDALPGVKDPISGVVDPTSGAKRWSANYTAISVTSHISVRLTVDPSVGTQVVLFDGYVDGSLGSVSASGCAGVTCA